ncbi:MAG: DUF4349 domain-containing protein [Candidatus Paceibacterota bacterium]
MFLKNKKKTAVTRKTIFLAVVGALIFVLIAGVILKLTGGSSTSTSDSSAPGVAQEQYARDTDKSAPRGEVVANGSSRVDDRRIVRTADLSLIVGDTDEVVGQISGIAIGAGGYVSSVDVFETSDNKKHGQITIRVPAEVFGRSVLLIKDQAVSVEREQANAHDVTEQFVDLEARLRNLAATEEQYLSLLNEATDVEDMLAIQRELSGVRQAIELLENRLRYLSSQVEMSTIRVSLISEADIEIFGVTWSPIKEVKEGVRMLLTELISFGNFLIALVFFLPVLLLWILFVVLVGGAVWKAGRWAKCRYTKICTTKSKRS